MRTVLEWLAGWCLASVILSPIVGHLLGRNDRDARKMYAASSFLRERPPAPRLRPVQG